MSGLSIIAGESPARPLTEEEEAIRSLRRGADRAEQLVVELKRLRAQTTQQQQWLDDPANPTDDIWFRRKDIWSDRWVCFYQDLGNLVGLVAIKLAEAGRIQSAAIRQRVAADVARLYAIEQWIDDSGATELRQYPNEDEEIPF